MADDNKDLQESTKLDAEDSDKNESIDDLNESEIDESSDVGTPTLEDYNKLKQINKKLFARAKKAEDKFKNLPPKKDSETNSEDNKNTNTNSLTSKTNTQNLSYLTREEAEEMLITSTKGYDEETMTVLKKISKGSGVSLAQALNDPLFKLHLKEVEQAAKSKKAKLAASTGSSKFVKSDSSKPLTREEHQNAWKQAQG